MLVIVGISLVLQYILYKIIQPLGKIYFSGPVPTKAEQDDNSKWITAYLERWPNSPLAIKYRNEAARAHAYQAYLQLQQRYEAGSVDEIDYQLELGRILPLIDVQKDIADILEKA